MKTSSRGGSLRLAYLQDTVTSILVADYFSLPKIGALIPADLVLWLRESALRWMLLAAAGEQLWVKAYLKIRFHSQREGEGMKERERERKPSPHASPGGARDLPNCLQGSMCTL
ncbi:hypothetical protein ATANTOWER_006566 [Ataeniobius toweri]|uniref:Uncharacterized protein n=1 Tax=Ataeniobius toweri TaxID=208326 RepID=A0ABU7AEG4_9TELE|nr:hypothetical protein [Ataeniobius toweri]